MNVLRDLDTSTPVEQKCAIYACSATGKEFASADWIETCKFYAKQNRYVIDNWHVYQEIKPSSGSPRQHKQFSQLLEAVRKGHFYALMLASIDRLSRDNTVTTQTLEELKGHSVRAAPVELHAIRQLTRLAEVEK